MALPDGQPDGPGLSFKQAQVRPKRCLGELEMGHTVTTPMMRRSSMQE
jgi:hypothetical protein